MRWDDIWVRSCAAVLGRREPTLDAVAQGRYDEVACRADGYLATAVAADDDMPGMAVEAAHRALERSLLDPTEIDLVVHAAFGREAPQYKAPASYVQSRTVGSRGLAFEINQHSNGGLVALHVGAACLTAENRFGRPFGAALLTTGEPCAAKNRYRAVKGVVFGDGATALVLTRQSGAAQLLSTVVLGDSTFSDLPDEPAIDARAAFLAEHGDRLVRMVESLTDLQREAIVSALAEAGIDRAEVGRWVFANLGETQVDGELRREFGIDASATTWGWGRQVGHLGAGDQIGGLADLLESGAVGDGDYVAMCGVGYGFTTSCAVLRIGPSASE